MNLYEIPSCVGADLRPGELDCTVALPSLGLSERGEVRWCWLVLGLVMLLRWLWMGRNVFGGAGVGLQGTVHNISGQSFKLNFFRVSNYERAQPLVFHLMGRLRSLEVKS